MEIKILTEKNNPLLKRKEIVFSIEYTSSTPSKGEMQLAVSKQFNTDLNKVEIRKILSTVGKSSGKAWVNIWEEKEVPVHGKKVEPVEEKPAEEPKAEEATPEEK